jgi:hypothetical protein
MMTSAQGVWADANSSGFGAAFGYAQAIGSIGGADASAGAITVFGPDAYSSVFTGGPAAAYSTAFSTPFGQAAWVQVASFPGGFGSAWADASP